MQRYTFSTKKFCRIILLISCLILLLSSNINIIQAQCHCNLKSLEEVAKSTKEIFVGQAIKKAINPNKTPEEYRRSKYRGIVTTFKVRMVYKGTLELLEEVEVLSGNGIQDNSINFVLGDSYIIFLENFIDSCSYTKPYSNKYSYQVNRVIRDSVNGAPPPPPPPPVILSYEASLFRYETKPRFFDKGLNSVFQLKSQPSKTIDYEIVTEDLKNFIHQNLGLRLGKLHLSWQVNQNQSFTILSYGRSSPEIIKACELLMDYLSNKYIITTEGYDCLLRNTYLHFSFQY